MSAHMVLPAYLGQGLRYSVQAYVSKNLSDAERKRRLRVVHTCLP